MKVSKGAVTKENILKAASDLSSRFGFEALSIGKLADNVGLSKSGLFGHFKSKETLQAMVLEYSAENFTLKVLKPSLKQARGLPRITAILDNWIKWTKTEKGGCPLLTAAIEFDDRPGEIQKVVRKLYKQQIQFYVKAVEIAVEEKQFPENTDSQQFAFEFYSLMAGHHIFVRLLKEKKAEDRLLLAYQELINKFLNN